MPTVDIIDELYVVADPAAVRAATCDVERWRVWFPGLVLRPYDDRGPLGVRWHLDGALVGTAEVWLEEFGDGVIVHTFLRAEPAARRRSNVKKLGVAIKQRMTAIKDELEAGRAPGVARIPLARRAVRPGRSKPRSATARRRGAARAR